MSAFLQGGRLPITGAAGGIGLAVARAALSAGGRVAMAGLAPVRVNAVAPGVIDTRMAIMRDGTHEHEADWFRDVHIGHRKFPLVRSGTAADCAGAFLFLLSDPSRCATGQCAAVDGGLTATC